MLEIITVVSLLLGIVTSIIAIGDSFKPGALIKGLFALSLCSGFIVFSKIIFENYYNIVNFTYPFIILLGIMASLFLVFKSKFPSCFGEGDTTYFKSFIPLLIISLMPILTLIANRITPISPVSPSPQEYIAVLKEMKISQESFMYMAESIPTTIFFSIKVFEFLTICILVFKSLRYVLIIEFTEKYIPKRIIKFMTMSTITVCIIFIFSSTNIFVLVLEQVYQWF